jgi:hypothetical protein
MAGSDKCDRPRRKWWRKLEICKIARRAVACYRALSGRLSGAGAPSGWSPIPRGAADLTLEGRDG